MRQTVERDASARSLWLDLADLDVEPRKNVLRVLKEHETREAVLRAEVGRLQQQLRGLDRTGPSRMPSRPCPHCGCERR